MLNSTIPANCWAGIPKTDASPCYVGHVNRTQSRTGTLWEGRYKSAILDSEAGLPALYRGNPLRAAMVARAEDYPWSRYCRTPTPSRERYDIPATLNP